MTKVDRRRSELGAIHAGKRSLGLDDDAYRDLLEEATGKRSAADMTPAERGAVLDAMRSAGFKRSRPWSGSRRENPQIGKIRALWGNLDDLGALRDHSDPALQKFGQRQTGKSRLEWCTPAELNVVIEALKSWERRIRRGAAAAEEKAR